MSKRKLGVTFSGVPAGQWMELRERFPALSDSERLSVVMDALDSDPFSIVTSGIENARKIAYQMRAPQAELISRMEVLIAKTRNGCMEVGDVVQALDRVRQDLESSAAVADVEVTA